MILQLNPPLPLETPRGEALAHLVIDMGAEHHLLWVCFLDDGGQCWTFNNPEVRMQANQTMGRTIEGTRTNGIPIQHVPNLEKQRSVDAVDGRAEYIDECIKAGRMP